MDQVSGIALVGGSGSGSLLRLQWSYQTGLPSISRLSEAERSTFHLTFPFKPLILKSKRYAPLSMYSVPTLWLSNKPFWWMTASGFLIFLQFNNHLVMVVVRNKYRITVLFSTCSDFFQIYCFKKYYARSTFSFKNFKNREVYNVSSEIFSLCLPCSLSYFAVVTTVHSCLQINPDLVLCNTINRCVDWKSGIFNS